MTQAQQLIQDINGLLVPGTGITAAIHQDVESRIVTFAERQWLVGDVKEVDCNTQYISDNFEDNGKGKVGGERDGWAICNGNNLTKNRMGRVSVGYGSLNNVNFPMELHTGDVNVGGEQTHTLSIPEMPAHAHAVQFREDSSSSGDYATIPYTSGNDEGRWSGVASNPGGNSAGGSFRVLNTGGDSNSLTVSHNNMQPYIVTLFIQKIY